MSPPRWVRNVAIGGGLALASTYAYGTANYRRNAAVGFDLPDPPAPGTPEFARLVEALTGAPLRHGNRVKILRNGNETFSEMLDAIRAAERTVDLSSYIYWPGEVTSRFTEALTDRARAGVEVNVVLDAYGSAKLDRDHVRTLDDAGVHLSFIRPPKWYTLHKLNNRMHRRLLVIDGTIGFAGGVGIADVWDGDAEDSEHWRETHVRVEGPAVRDVLGGFLENWTSATQRFLGPAHLPELAELEGGIDVHVTRSSPTSGSTAASQLFYSVIAGARERLWVTTAYFTPGPAFVDVLCAAARRGVDVRILVNGRRVDKEVVRRTGQLRYDTLIESGVRIFEYDHTMLHAKVLIVDDGWANVGSSNFDHRSFGLDDELNVSFYDAAAVAQLEKHFLEDLDGAEEIGLKRWRSRPLRRRVVEHAADLARQSF
jgi:cardiolipin synthase A/B